MWRQFRAFIVSAMVLTALPSLFVLSHVEATAGINKEMSFEGKVTTTAGTNIPDGTYNVEFKIYSGGTQTGGGTLVWTEDWLVGNAQGIKFTSGTFQANLGSIASLSGINWNSNPLYLSLQVGNTASCTISTTFQANCSGDGEMTPYILLTATPYAMNADQLGGLTASSFGQLNNSQTWTGANTIQNTASNALKVASASGTATLTADTSNGQVLIGQAGSSGQNGQIVFNSATVNGYAVTLNTSGSLAASYTLTLPTTAPTTGQCLMSGATTASQLAFGTCGSGGGGSLQTAYSTGSTINTTAGGTISIAAAAVPTADMVSISNTAQGITTSGVNDLSVNFVGGNAAIESSGVRIDYAPGGTSGGTWSGLRIVANATGAATGVTAYGIKLEGPSTAGSGTNEGLYVGTGWNIGLDIQSGGIQLAAQTDPAAPAAGNLRIYAKNIAGRILPKWIGPSGVDTPFQANLGFNRVSVVMPAGGTTLSTFVGGFGTTFTNTGTAANPTPTSTNLFTSVRRATFSTGTTAGTVASHRQSTLQVWRGNATGLGGFFYTIRFGTDTLASGNRAFAGMADSVSAPTNVDPTTTTTPGKIGMAINTNTGNWNFVTNVTGTAPTVTALGSSFPVNTTDLYELILYSPQNGSSIGWRVTDLSTGAQTSGTASTNIPTNTTFLAPQFWITNNATAAAATLDFSGWYLESDN